jgi:hypothetical protein
MVKQNITIAIIVIVLFILLALLAVAIHLFRVRLSVFITRRMGVPNEGEEEEV